jgi:hypothetical protein
MGVSHEHPPRNSLVQVRVGNRVYDARRVSSCMCCNHPARMQIERMVVEGHPYQVIARQFSEVDYVVAGEEKKLPRIEWSSIRTHYRNGHMPTELKAIRQIVDQRLDEIGQHAEELQGMFVDSYTVARTVMNIGVQKLINGEITPSVKEMLAAAKLVKEMELNEQNNGSATDMEWQEAMSIYFTQARQLMPEDMWETFVRRLTLNPQLRALQERLESQQRGDDEGSGDYVDAEVVDERSS